MSTDLALEIALAREAFAVPARGAMPLGGGATANRVVALTDAAGQARWVLRCPLRDPRPARMDFLLGFHRLARAGGLPVAVPHPTLDGRRWAEDASGRPWVLLEYLPGRPLTTVTAPLAEQAAHQLAAVHHLPTDKALQTVEVGPDSRWDAWLTASDGTWQATAEIADDYRVLLADYRRYVDLLHQYGDALRTLEAKQWGHGDFHGHNLLHQDGRITGVLDLDGVGRRPRVTDVATAVLMLARTGSGDYRLQPDLIRAVLTGYQRHPATPLTQTERASLWPAMVLSQLPDPHHLTALRRAGSPMAPALAQPLAALRALHHQHTALMPLLTAERTR
ncbi:phosphotransferase [Streptomyces olivoreticuli]|uniref:phosphotransferase enzyme family protein n=1 Tax=Streptomyces olivoreticuli TaxID=68246 RepID=UPI00265A6B62|nr:phosphotransferase [Streptomyces olivoreticuli]WKK24238.1 phosphotransferase [Streptomyces olivoreticuli]